MIIDPKKKAGTLATPRYVPKESKPLEISLAMRNVMERLRQPKMISMASSAEYNEFKGKK